jgi:hypothetical protein
MDFGGIELKGCNHMLMALRSTKVTVVLVANARPMLLVSWLPLWLQMHCDVARTFSRWRLYRSALTYSS